MDNELLRGLRANDPSFNSLDLDQACIDTEALDDDDLVVLSRELETNHTFIYVHLEANRFGFVGVRALASMLQINHTITHLHLDANQIGPSGAHALATAFPHNSSLTHLYLRTTMIGEDGARALAAALPTSSLVHLDLEVNNIGDEGAQALAAALPTSALVELHLMENDVGDDGVEAFAQAFETNPTLTTTVYLRRNPCYCNGPTKALNVMELYRQFNRRNRQLILQTDFTPGLWPHVLANNMRPHRHDFYHNQFDKMFYYLQEKGGEMLLHRNATVTHP